MFEHPSENRASHRASWSRTCSWLAIAALSASLIACNSEESDTCDQGANEGNGDVPPSFPIEMGRTAGTFPFQYETRNAKDRVEVFYEGMLLYDSGCVSESRDVELAYGPGSSTRIDVVVSPNCDGTPLTSWRFTVGCPVAPLSFQQSVTVDQPKHR